MNLYDRNSFIRKQFIIFLYFTEYLWVEDDICEVQMKLTNPLPFELKVSNMRLLTSGVVFESIPETVLLAPDAPTTVNLHGTPKEIGELQVRLKLYSKDIYPQYK